MCGKPSISALLNRHAVTVKPLIPGFPLDGWRVFRAIVLGVSKTFDGLTFMPATQDDSLDFFLIIVGVSQALRGTCMDC